MNLLRNVLLSILVIFGMLGLSACHSKQPSRATSQSLNKGKSNSVKTTKPKTQTSRPESTSQQIQNLLAKFGWHESGAAVSSWITQLPKSYKLKLGQIPIGLYWSYHNVLSKNAGLDITPYLGQTVQVQAFPLKENWKTGPSWAHNYAIVTTHNNKVISAWISKGINGDIIDICESLNHKEFGDITKESWGNWVAQQNIVNYSDPFYSKMQKWTPKQLLEAYYKAINNHQYDNAYAMYSTAEQYQIMMENVDPGHLYNIKWDQNYGLSNWKSAKFLSVKRAQYPWATSKTYQQTAEKKHKQTAEYRLKNLQYTISKLYRVTFDATFKKEMVISNGQNTYFTTIVKESSNAPWTIASFSTGP